MKTANKPISFISLLLIMLAAITASPAAHAQQSNRLYIPDMNVAAGVTAEIPVYMSNTSPVTAIQFDLTPSYEVSLSDSDVTLSDRATDHIASRAFITSPTGYSTIRVIIYSPTNTQLQGRSGQVVSVPVTISQYANEGSTLGFELSNVTLCLADGTDVTTSYETGTVTVQRGPDFEVSDVAVASPSPLVPGNTIDMTWTVTNVGQRPATGGWKEYVLLTNGTDESIVATTYHTSPLLGVGESANRSLTATLPETPGMDGDVSLRVRLIPDSESGESYSARGNNTADSPSPLTLARRLYLSLPYDRLYENENYPVRYTLRRSGNVTRDETFDVVVDGTDRLATSATITIPAGRNYVGGYLNTVDNSTLDTDTLATVSISGCDYPAAEATVIIEDDEFADLTITSSATSIEEGEELTLTISTNRVTDTPVTVYLATDFPQAFTLPSTVVIPAGETSVTVNVTTRDDSEPSSDIEAEFIATADRHNEAMAYMTMLDNDIPRITLVLSTGKVSESDGANAIAATLRRHTLTDATVNILLSDNTGGRLIYPNTTMVLEPGVESVEFAIGVVDNATVDGDIEARITAAVQLVSCSCTVSGKSAGSATAALTILDNDGPTLTLTASTPTVLEGSETLITLRRNTSAETALTVNIESDNDNMLHYDHTVTLAAGESSVIIPVKVDSNEVTGDSHTVVFSATADGFTEGTCWLMVTDRTLPDLAITDMSITPDRLMSGEEVLVTVTVENKGTIAARDVAVQVSFNNDVVGLITFDAPIAPGESVSGMSAFTIEGQVGNSLLTAAVNAQRNIEESLYSNNSMTETLVINPPFTATVTCDRAVYMPGEEVTLHGTATGRFSEGDDVTVYIMTGATRTYTTTLDASGNFTLTFTPAEREMGHYEACATYPGDNTIIPTAEFDVAGFYAADPAMSFEMEVGSEYEGVINISNPGPLTMTGITATALNLPDHYTIDFDLPSTIPSSSGVAVKYRVNATAASPGYDWDTFTIKIASAEGAEAGVYVRCHADNPYATLISEMSSISTTMTKGATREYRFRIANNSQVASGAVSVAIPDGLEWMRLVTPSVMGSLAPGEEATIVLSLTPAEDAIVGAVHTGKIAVNCANGQGLAIDYDIQTVSTSMGAVEIEVCDENTYYGAGSPRVSGAQVSLTQYYTGKEVARGTTADDGLFTAEVTEGYYTLTVGEPSHTTQQTVIEVAPDRTTRKVVNISITGITIDYTVERTTVEDEYNLVTTVDYQTNVPVPVVVLSMPQSIPAHALAEGQSLIFNAVLTNQGLITAQDTQLELPTDFNTLVFEALSHNAPFDLAPGQSVTIPVKVTKIARAQSPLMQRKTGHLDNDPCAGQPGTLYFWDCGTDRKWHRYSIGLQLGTCDSNDPSTWNNAGSGNGGGGGVRTGYWGWGGLGGGGSNPRGSINTPASGKNEPSKPSVAEDKGCEPCQNQFLIDFIDCALPQAEPLKDAWECLSSLIEKFRRYKPDENILKTLKEMTNLLATKCHVKQLQPLNDLIKEVEDQIEQFRETYEMMQKAQAGELDIRPLTLHDIAPDYFDENGRVNLDNIKDALWDRYNQELDNLTDELIKKLPPLPRAVACWIRAGMKHCDKSGEPAKIKALADDTPSYADEYPQYILDMQQASGYAAIDAICSFGPIVEFFGNNEWFAATEDELIDFLSFITSSEDGVIDYEASLDTLNALKPAKVSQEAVRQLVERWNNTLTGSTDDNRIDLFYIHTFMILHEALDNKAVEDGYESVSDRYDAEYASLIEEQRNFENSVCSTITLQLSQKVTMAREAFRGTLTVTNGHTELPMTDVVLTIAIRDEEGHTATAREMQVNAETLTGFRGENEVNGVWSLDAGQTGVATLMFIPTKYAAPDEPVTYSFGGSLTYRDPFTGTVVTRTLFPITLDVNPTAELNIDVFIQRDVIGDDPLTEEVESSEPAEYTVMVNNIGKGDADNVIFQAPVPEIIRNDKGLADPDFKIVASMLNGKECSLVLSGNSPVEFGNIAAGTASYAQWWMTAKYLGHFDGYSLEATHVSGFGNPDLSLINKAEIHELIRSINIFSTATAGDSIKGFLVNDIADKHDTPDMLIMSDGTDAEVAEATGATAMYVGDNTVRLTVRPSAAGWNYGYIQDPTGGYSSLISVADAATGATLDLRSFWQTDRTLRDGRDPIYESLLHFVDKYDGENTEKSYLLTFAPRPDIVVEVDSVVAEGVSNYFSPAAVTKATVYFNKPVKAATFTADDLTLTREGKRVESLEGVTVTAVSDDSRVFDLNLTAATALNGYYVLTVATDRIEDAEGFAGSTGRSTMWTQYADGKVNIDINVTPAEGGEVTPARGAYAYDEPVTFRALPTEGYEVRGWLDESGAVMTEADSLSLTPRGDRELTLQLARKSHIVTIDYNVDGGRVDGAVSAAYLHGDTINLEATALYGYRFTGWTINGQSAGTFSTLRLAVTSAMTVEAFFEARETATVSYSLAKGWNWVTITVDAGVTAPADLFGDVALDNDNNPSEMLPGQPYRMKVATAVNTSLTGFIEPRAVSVNSGWNMWPFVSETAVSLTDAFAGDVDEGDMVRSLTAFAVYHDGGWTGSLTVLMPGESYMYYSASAKTLGTVRTSSSLTDSEPDGSAAGWSADTHAYSDNMGVTATLSAFDGTPLADDGYLIGAFVGDECRGIAVVDRQMQFITVNGQTAGDEVSFKAFCLNDGATYPIVEKLQWQAGVTGTPDAPVVLHVDNSSLVDNIAGVAGHYGLYPNPADDIVTLTGDCSDIVRVDILATDGSLVATADTVDNPTFNVATLPVGTYLVALYDRSGAMTPLRLIVRH